MECLSYTKHIERLTTESKRLHFSKLLELLNIISQKPGPHVMTKSWLLGLELTGVPSGRCQSPYVLPTWFCHRRIVPSSLPDAYNSPSGEYLMQCTGPKCFLYDSRTLPASIPTLYTCRSSPPQTKYR